MQLLAERLKDVHIVCGDWRRVLTPACTVDLSGITAVFLDPPYSLSEREHGLYAVDHPDVAEAVREWAVEHGDDPRFRIALCGYDGEHDVPGWEPLRWKAKGGYANVGTPGRGRENAERETVWFSPHCLPGTASQVSMFEAYQAESPWPGKPFEEDLIGA